MNGEQIAVALEQAGLFSQVGLDALVTAQASREHLSVIVDLGGPRVDVGESREDAWRALAELVATGMSADEGRQWRSLGLGDVSVETLRGNLDLAVVAAIMSQDEHHQTMLPGWLHLTRQARIPDGELPGWVRAGLITPFPASPEGVVHAIARWRARLKDRAVVWAAAGYGLDEACAMDDGGLFDVDALTALAALRGGAGVAASAA